MKPSSQAQLDFLKQLQRIFSEGEFVATYKFALLHAIADICVERADDPAGQLHIPLRDLGEKFLELYWNHAAPYRNSVIAQNTGQQAAIVNELEGRRGTYKTLTKFRASADWTRSVTSAATLIRNMPLWKLQTLGGKQHDFLYPNEIVERGIMLRPGVAYCLRVFYPLVLNLVREQWVSHIRSIPANEGITGPSRDLESFLFGSRRNALESAQPVLQEIQEDRCFYCGKRIRGDWHVDHFIPWARYPRDLGHNFVLAHDRCNLAKRDTLAAGAHLARWLERNDSHGEMLARELAQSFICDSDASKRVARWSYGLDADTKARLWLLGKQYEPMDPNILEFF